MAPQPNDPGRKAVFKINSGPGKLSYSRNTPEGCAHCNVLRAPGAPPMQICSGCRGVRYCSPEHQKAHWKIHKGFCTLEQTRRARELNGHPSHPLHTCGLPSAQERMYLVQDWKELHVKTLDAAVAWAILEAPKPYDFHKTCVWFDLKYRKEAEGNPSLAFEIQSAHLAPAPPAGTPAGMSYAAYMPMIEKTHDEEKSSPGYMAYVPCVYVMDGDAPWLTATCIYRSDIPTYRTGNKPFYYLAKHCASCGLVWRLVGDSGKSWAPGLMSKHPGGGKWVWKSHTVPELAAKGVYLKPKD
ncbi:hypothetical protein BDZ89DRAFT_1065854 [Hymenopellis radicata]|nr:hypothetical protein BDZ89DRAFT_1065854 [Hymenopellis radicata]